MCKSDSARSRGGPVWAVMCLAVMAGCAGNPPIDTIANADTAVNQAMNANASRYAPTDLQRALDKVARAKRAMADENYERARRLAEEARVDAQAAEAKAKAEQARQTAQQAQQTIRMLRGGGQSTTPGSGTTDGGMNHGDQ